MATKHLKNLLAHTSIRSRFPAIQQFNSGAAFTGSRPSGDAGSQIQSQIQALTGSVSGGPGSDVAEQVATLSKHLNDLKLAQQLSLDSLNQNTQALVQNTVTKASGSSSSSITGGLLSQIGTTFAFSPIVRGLFSLFGGGGSSQTAQPLVPFTLPASIQYQGAYSPANRGQVSGVDYGQNGTPRVASAAPSTNVQIQVNAMDSRSFLDHSADIAAAVREAMLHSNSLNDVIADL